MANDENKRVIERYDVSEVLMNHHGDDNKRELILPMIRWNSILGRPQVTTTNNIIQTGAPYHLLVKDTVELTNEEISNLIPNLVGGGK